MGTELVERRRHPRRSVEFPVWFSSGGEEGYVPRWRFGEVTDVSLGGARICSDDARNLTCGVFLEILCLTEPGQGGAIDSPTPLRMHGRVIWCDRLRGVVGIAHE